MKKFLILFIALFLLVGCSNSNVKEKKQETDKKEIVMEKLKQSLLENDFVEYEPGEFRQVRTEQYTSDGYIENLDITYFSLNSLNATDMTSNMKSLRTSQTNEYNFRTDTGKGNFIFFASDSNEWENKYDYVYDFGSGNSSCKAMVGSCNRQSVLIDLKNRWVSFMKNNNIDIEIIK